jgi:hypothetical protein
VWNGKDCESVDPIEPIRQGDILKRFRDGRGDSIFVVISADCDIAQAKVGDSGIACVELQPLREYLCGDHLFKIATRQFESRTKELKDWIRKRKLLLSDKAVDEWIRVATAEEIIENLELKDKKDSRFVEDTLRSIQAARFHLSNSRDARSALNVLHNLQRATPKDWRTFVYGQLSKLQSAQLPEDLFFICSIPSEQMLGYLAKLRNITFLGISTVVSTIPAARERSIGFVRIARLSATFKHGLAQQVGYLFARIGYPREYEQERDAIFDMVVEELCQELGEKRA